MIKVSSRRFENRIEWYKEGTDILHREDGPAIEWNHGTKHWYQNGKLYRKDGPVIETDKLKAYYQAYGLNGEAGYHREDGPAIEKNDGTKVYYYRGMPYENISSDEEWINFICILKIID